MGMVRGLKARRPLWPPSSPPPFQRQPGRSATYLHARGRREDCVPGQPVQERSRRQAAQEQAQATEADDCAVQPSHAGCVRSPCERGSGTSTQRGNISSRRRTQERA